MNGPIDSASNGLARAEAQLARSARRLSAPQIDKQRGGFAAAQKAFAPKTESDGDSKRFAGQSAAARRGPGGAAVTSQGSYLPSLAEETVQMRIAANAYAANASMMRSAEDILKMTQQALASSSDSDDN